MKCLKSGKDQKDFLMGIQKSKQETRWILVNSRAQFGPDNEVDQVVSTFFDITEMRQMEIAFLKVFKESHGFF